MFLFLKGKVWSFARFRLYPASRVTGRGPAGLGTVVVSSWLNLPVNRDSESGFRQCPAAPRCPRPGSGCNRRDESTVTTVRHWHAFARPCSHGSNVAPSARPQNGNPWPPTVICIWNPTSTHLDRIIFQNSSMYMSEHGTDMSVHVYTSS
jgi:hypothetical protein